MNKEEFFKQYTGRYRLTKIVIGTKDCSEPYTNGWKDKSLYMYLEITPDERFFLKLHTNNGEKEYNYFFDAENMKYHMKEDLSDAGTPIRIENGIITEETNDHLMIYELTEELN